MKSVLKLLLVTTFVIFAGACSQPDSDQQTEEDSQSGGSAANIEEPSLASSSPAVPEPGVAAHEGTPIEIPSEPAGPKPPDTPVSSTSSEDQGPTIYSGVYNAAQAARGELVHERSCSVCHASDDWAQGRLLTNYTGQSVFDFVEHLRITMPMDGPGRLPIQQYVDVTAFILSINNIPAGSSELPIDEDALSEVRMEYRR